MKGRCWFVDFGGNLRDGYNAAEWLIDRNLLSGNGGRTAVITESESLTYMKMAGEVFRVQNALQALGVRREERVALVLNDEPAFPAWFLGCMRSGIVPIPLSTMLTGGELGAIADDALAGVVVVSGEYADKLPAMLKSAPLIRAVVLVGPGDVSAPVAIHRWEDFTDTSEPPVCSTGPDSPGFWLYSSGTTGMPKGVMHRQASLQYTADTYASSVLAVTQEDIFFSAAKLFFAFGLGNSLTFPFSVGASVVLDPRRATPKGVAETVGRFRPTLFFGSPGLLASILDAEIDVGAFSSVRLGVTAGEALPAEIYKRFNSSYRVEVLDGIGSTEALHIFLSNRAGDVRPGTSGRPVPGYQLKLLDEKGGEIVDPDVPGYLHVSGGSTAIGYWSRTEATKSAFLGPWLRTGDVYVRSQDGYYKFLGRNNDMIKVGGIWVSPAEVEAVLVEHPDVLEAAVVGGYNEDALETSVAFIVARAGRLVDEDSIEAHCRSRIAAFKRPRVVVFVEELPKTATGKVQRYQLRERLGAREVE